MDDVQQMIINEVKRLERFIDKRVKVLEKLEKESKVRTSPRRYVLEYDVEPTENSIGQPITRSFVVDKDCSRFFCQDVVCTVAAVGQVDGILSSNKFTLSPEQVVALDFTWSIRDTSTDREWQNTPLPRYFLASGLTAALPMPWFAPLRPGTEIETIIVPTYATNNVSGFTPGGVSSFTVQVAFVGFEVL